MARPLGALDNDTSNQHLRATLLAPGDLSMRALAKSSSWIILCTILLSSIGCGAPQEQPAVPPPDASPAPEPAAAVYPPAPTDPNVNVTLSLYLMSQCPFGTSALKVAHRVESAFGPEFALRLVFIVGETKEGELDSLHGKDEMTLNRILACAGRLYPRRVAGYAIAMNEIEKAWHEVAQGIGLDPKLVNVCLQDGGDEVELRRHLAETNALNIDASPTILINRAPYRGPINSHALFDAVCLAFGETKPDVCGNPPEILSYTDGGEEGSCAPEEEEPPPAELVDDYAFTLRAVTDQAILETERMPEVVEQLKKFYPNMQVASIDASSPEGIALIERYGIEQLVAYLFPAEMEQRENFQTISEVLEKRGDVFLLNPGIGSSFFPKRSRRAKLVEVFFNPFSLEAQDIIRDIDDLRARPEIAGLGLTLSLVPITLQDLTQPGHPEIEELQRVQAVQNLAPEKLWSYLKARYDLPYSSWWEDYITAIGLVPQEIKREAQTAKVMEQIRANVDRLKEFGVQGDLLVFAENRELIRIENKEDFKSLLLTLGSR